MRTHESRNQIHTVMLVEVTDDLQRREFMLGRKTVAALGLAGGRTEVHHLVKRLGSLGSQLLLARLAGGVGGRLDAAAGVLDLKVGLAVELHTQLILAPAAENKMRMRVHKAGRDKLSICIDDLRALAGGNRTGADGGDHAVLDEHPRILEEFDLSLLFAAMGAFALGCCKQADVFYKHFLHITVLPVAEKGRNRFSSPIITQKGAYCYAPF